MKATPNATGAAGRPSPAVPTALIAEDEPLLALWLEGELRRTLPELLVVARAADGPAAIALTLQLRPDICFLDIRMPGRSGLEVAESLAEDGPAATALPLLVFVTAYDEYALQAFDANAVDYLTKPVAPRRLTECVQRLQQRWAERRRVAPDPQVEIDRHLILQLDSQRFWPIHRGTVVQARRIAEAHRDESGKIRLRLRDSPDTLVVSRLHAGHFKGM